MLKYGDKMLNSMDKGDLINKKMLLVCTALVFLILGATNVNAGTASFTEYVEYDTYVSRSAATTNYDSAATTRIYAWHVGNRIYLNVNLNSANFTSLSKVTSAILQLNRTYLRSGEDANFLVRSYWVNRTNLTSALTWNNQACGTTSDTYPSYCINKGDSNTAISNTLGLINFTITKIVNASFIQGDKNVTVMLVDSLEDGVYYHEARFDAWYYGDYHPRVYITGETPTYNTTISVTSPTNSTYITDAVYLNFTPTNAVLNSTPCFYYLDNVEYSLSNVTNNTVSSTYVSGLAGGSHNVYYKCQNSDLTYTQTAKVYFYIDEPPVVTISDLQTSYSLNNSIVEFQFYANDDVSTTLTCNYSVDSTGYPNFNVLENQTVVKTVGGVSDGSHTLTVTCWDSQGSIATDSYVFDIDRGTLRVCFYTYDDYRDWINNNSITVSNKPNALRDTVLFNDTLGKVWSVQYFTKLKPRYTCTTLINGCANLTVYSTGRYKVYLADNTDFTDDCKPLTYNARYNEFIGDFYFPLGADKYETRFIDFESNTATYDGTSIGALVLQVFTLVLYAMVIVFAISAAAFTGMPIIGLGVGLAGALLVNFIISPMLQGVFI